jgi:Uma2 family endonuclease
MDMSTTVQLITATELARIPDDGFRYELVRGEIRKMAPASFDHGRYAAKVAGTIIPHVEANKLGVVCIADTGFLISSNPDTVRAPDVAFISQARLDQIGKVKVFFPGPPDLAVEVISPGDTYSEVQEKVFDWLEAGTLMVIVVDPRKWAVTVYRSLTEITVLTENEILNGGDVVPGWSMPVRKTFE